MRISVTAPVEQALNHTKAILFDNFRFRMWLGLGFCAFLNRLFGRTNFNANFNFPTSGPSSGGGGSTAFDFSKPIAELRRYIEGLPIEIYLLAAGVILLSLLLGMLLAWLQARGSFMFLDGVLNNSGAVREPWRRFRYLGNSAFRLQLALLIFGMGLALPLISLLLMRFVYPELFRPMLPVLTALLIAIGIAFVCYILANLVIQAVLQDFLVPVMYRRNLRVGDAWGVFRSEILPGRLGTLVLFYGLRILLVLASGIIIMIGACVTCCIGALPYISSVLFLPIHVFLRLYPIYFLEQFGPDWWFFERAEPGTEGGPERGANDPADPNPAPAL